MVTQKAELILAIESSCDDTAVALVDMQGEIVANVIHSQINEQAPYGGIIPELASRNHLLQITQCTQRLFDQAQISLEAIRWVAVTNTPGLIGPLLVGVQFAKGFAHALGRPLLGIHHIEGHIYASYTHKDFPQKAFISLIVSGGHSALYLVNKHNIQLLGQTRDDAAGEAFDKIGKMLDLPYPAGPHIDRLSAQGRSIFRFPRAMQNEQGLEFSFSGLKTAVRLFIEKQKQQGQVIENQLLYDVCASVQQAIVDALLTKAFLACQAYQVDSLVLGGGVCANESLRQTTQREGKKKGIQVIVPPKSECVDNAVMIGRAALHRIQKGKLPSSVGLYEVCACAWTAINNL